MWLAEEVDEAVKAYETPVKVSNQQSEFMRASDENLFSLNFVHESPVENCLTSALGRSLSQKNDFWCLG